MITPLGHALAWPNLLLCFFSCFFACALARQRFFHALFLARLQVKGVTLYFFNNVLLLYLALKTAQSIFKRFAFLQSYFCQKLTPPNWSWLDPLVIAR